MAKKNIQTNLSNKDVYDDDNTEFRLPTDSEVLMMQEPEPQPISDDFHVQKNDSMVAPINTILTNVQTLIYYLEVAHSKSPFSFSECSDIFNAITEINSVTNSLEN